MSLITVPLILAIILVLRIGRFGVGISNRMVALQNLPPFPARRVFNFAPASLYEITDPGEREALKVAFT